MSKSFKFLIIFYCILLQNCLINCHKDHEIKPTSEVFTGENAKRTTEDHSNLSKISCVLMKSLAYGFQRAVNEYSLINHETNFARAIKDVDVAHYLSDLCPDAPENPKENHENGHKVKRNHHSINVRSKPVNITTNSTNTNATKPGNINEHHDKAPNVQSNHQINEFERLLKNFEEVTNALKLQLTASAHHHFKQANGSIDTPVQNKTNSHVKGTPFEGAPDVNVTFVDVNPQKNETKVEKAESKSRHRHNHSHKKHKHLNTKTVPQEENAVEQNNIADDMYVAERLKEEEKKEKLEKTQEVEKQVNNNQAAPKIGAKHIVKRSADKNMKKQGGFNKKNKVADGHNQKLVKKQKKYQGKSKDLHKKQKSKKNTSKQ